MKTLKGNQTWLSKEEKKYVTIIEEKDGLLFCKYSYRDLISIKTKAEFEFEIGRFYPRLEAKFQRQYNAGFENGKKWRELSGYWQDENLRKVESGSRDCYFEFDFHIWIYWNAYKDAIIYTDANKK